MRKVMIDSYILDTLMRDLVGHDKAPSAFVVFIYLWRRTSGMRLRSLTASLQEIANDTGLSKSAVQSGLKLLSRRRLIRTERESLTSTPRHFPLRPWVRSRRTSKPGAKKLKPISVVSDGNQLGKQTQ